MSNKSFFEGDFVPNLYQKLPKDGNNKRAVDEELWGCLKKTLLSDAKGEETGPG